MRGYIIVSSLGLISSCFINNFNYSSLQHFNLNHESEVSVESLSSFSSSTYLDDTSFVRSSYTYEEKPKTSGIGASGSVNGYFTWVDDDGQVHPFIGAKVKITIAGSVWSEITYTNQLGFYNFNYQGIWYIGTGRPTITIYFENDNIKVVNNSNTVYSMSHEFNANSNTNTFSFCFIPELDGYLGKAAYIFQGAYQFSEYAEYLNGGIPLGICNVVYPYATENAFYSNGTIHINEHERYSQSMPSHYGDWDTIGHEYAHFVADYFNLSDSPGGQHLSRVNLIDYLHESGLPLSEAKSDGIYLAWSEGFASYWSIVAQESFSDDMKTVPFVGDTIITGSNASYIDVDSLSKSSKGDADEEAVASILYKLQSSNTDWIDKFSMGSITLWNILVENQITSLNQLVNVLCSSYYFEKHDFAILLSEANIIADDMVLTGNYLNDSPIFSWSTSMASKYLFYDEFDFYILDGNQRLVYMDLDIPADGTMVTYQIPRIEWYTIYSDIDTDVFYAYFIARQTDYFETGNYYSKLFEFDTPTENNPSLIVLPPIYDGEIYL